MKEKLRALSAKMKKKLLALSAKMKKKLLALSLLLALVCFGVTAAGVVFLMKTVSLNVIGFTMMGFCLVLAFAMVWLTIYEMLGG